MITIKRLLEYRWETREQAIHSLRNRAVKGTEQFGNCSIAESFYYEDNDAAVVLGQVVTPVTEGEPPDGNK